MRLRNAIVGAVLLGGCDKNPCCEPPVSIHLAFIVQPSTTAGGTTIAPAVQVAVQDLKGNTVTAVDGVVTLSLGADPAGGTLSGTTAVHAVNGVATFPAVRIDKTGTGYTLTATATGLTEATSAAFDVALGPAAQLAFTVQPSNTNTGAPITPAVQVTVQDAGGNTVTPFTGNVTIAIGANPASGTLAGTSTVQAVAGVASFSDLSINNAASGFALKATSGTLTGATSASFAITIGHVGPTAGLITFQSSHGIEEIGADGSARAVLIADSTLFMPAWSPDGTRLAFTRTADGWNTCEIYTARADGSGMQQITTPLTQPWCANSPAWSPDGTKIAFAAGLRGCADAPYCWGLKSIDVVNADGSNEKQVFTVASLPPPPYSNFHNIGLSTPTWSPDGTMIAFTCDATNGGDDLWWVCIGAAAGSSVRRLPDPVAESPAWSPDGSEIASASDVMENIILRNWDGSGVARTLTQPSGPPFTSMDFDPAWSPDGTQLVFARGYEGSNSDLFIINRDGTGLRRLTSTGDARQPTWRSATPQPLPQP